LPTSNVSLFGDSKMVNASLKESSYVLEYLLARQLSHTTRYQSAIVNNVRAIWRVKANGSRTRLRCRQVFL